MDPAKYTKTVLSNGMTLVAEHHPHVRSVSLGAWVKTGSACEKAAQNGISHFIEHMVFKGTERRSTLEIATALESLGGDLNAFTDREVTCYHATALSEHLDVAVDVLSDLVLNPTFPAEELEKERKVLLQELSMIEETPDDWINDVFFEAVWRKDPMGRPVIGSRKTIQAITRGQLLGYFRGYYRPENMVVSVAGNFDFGRLRDACERFFQGGRAEEGGNGGPAPHRVRFHPGRKHVAMPSEQLHLLVGFEGVAFQDPYRFDALILSFFLGGGMSSRLFQEIREKAGLAYTVDCDCVPFRDTGVFTIYSAMAPRSLAKCTDILAREIDRVRREKIPQVALDLVKSQLKGTILLSSDQMEIRQESLGRNEIVFGRYVSVEEVIAEIDRVSSERVHELAQKIFRSDRQAIVTLGKGDRKKISVA